MRFLRRYLRAPRTRRKRSLGLGIERLEHRLAMSATTVLPGDVAANAIVMTPAILSDSRLAFAGALAPGRAAESSLDSTPSSPVGFSPQQIRSAYGISNIAFGSSEGDGSGQTIAIVDAYDDPDLIDSASSSFSGSDLARFDQAFGLPDPPSFQKLNEYGDSTNLPGAEPGGAANPLGDWAIEEALDVEWAHAIAPEANIILIETDTDNGTDMYTGATTAAGLAGVSVVSMSWGANEYSGEPSFDSDFATPSGHQGVTFVASTGDNGAPGEYPAYSPNVLAAGGTSLSLNSGGSISGETAWSGGGGGISSYESEPAFQQGSQNTGERTIPDLSFDANPITGVAVYDSDTGASADPWQRIGGTSVAAPCLSGIIAIADQGRVFAGGTTLDGPIQTIPALYALPSSDYHDVTSGSNGGFNAGPGYDMATGMGSPDASLLIPDLADYGIAGNLAITSQPPSAVTAGNAFGMSVMVEGPDGRLETSYNGNVSVRLANNPSNDTLGGTITVTAQAGIATFSNLTLDRVAFGDTLLLDAGGTSFATSSAISVSPAAPARLVVISAPAGQVIAGAQFGLVVAVEDSFGNVETSYTGTVTALVATATTNREVGGFRAVAINQGVGVFTDLSIPKIGTHATVTLSAGEGLAIAKTARLDAVSAHRFLSKPQVRKSRTALRHEVHVSTNHANVR